MNTLYAIVAEIQAATMANEDGELPPELEARLDGLEMDLQTKVRNIVALYREWDTEGEAAKSEAARLAAIAKSRAGNADRLRAYLVHCLDAAGIATVKTDIGNVSVRSASRPSIRWEGAGPLPDEFVRTKVELDGAKAFDAYKAGTLPEGFVAERTRFVSVR